MREVTRIAAPPRELLFLGACMMVSWLLNAASMSGYMLLALFTFVSLARAFRHYASVIADRLPRRSQVRHYLLFTTSIAFFCLLAVRGCYLAAIIVDSELRTDPLKVH
ncbi:hypothetical protein [Labrys sp. ZIDIC5]|uniref:hypothetical protein n=2 Tax=Hyphomicrobiales TaxID=356 RepID=UPI002ACAB745|nr:hypothetical protein [Labrys sp. ZIDIC5]MDZ5451462.1 hypothetical protein [Labrys sp. ZIDIC5]